MKTAKLEFYEGVTFYIEEGLTFEYKGQFPIDNDNQIHPLYDGWVGFVSGDYTIAIGTCVVVRPRIAQELLLCGEPKGIAKLAVQNLRIDYERKLSRGEDGKRVYGDGSRLIVVEGFGMEIYRSPLTSGDRILKCHFGGAVIADV